MLFTMDWTLPQQSIKKKYSTSLPKGQSSKGILSIEVSLPDDSSSFQSDKNKNKIQANEQQQEEEETV